MKLFTNKKSEAITIFLVVLIVVVFLGWLINFASRECRSNSDCNNGFYCGSDYACHQIPVVEKTIIQNNLVAPAFVIGIAIIIAAIVLRWRRNPSKGTNHMETEQKQENKNPLKLP